MNTRMREAAWRLGGLGLLMAIVFVTAPTAEGGEPELTIYMKSGAGTIRADRVWEQGEYLCWESRGYQDCVTKELVVLVPPPRAPIVKPNSGPAGPGREAVR
jgi:hypothetical protein